MFDYQSNSHFKPRVGPSPAFVKVEPFHPENDADDDEVPPPPVYIEKGPLPPSMAEYPPLPSFQAVDGEERHPSPKPLRKH